MVPCFDPSNKQSTCTYKRSGIYGDTRVEIFKEEILAKASIGPPPFKLDDSAN